MWQESFEVYVEDKHDLDLKAFFETHSPFAYQDLTARMIETVRKAYWDADEATLTRLLDEYVDSVNTHGVGCSTHTCGNPRLLEYVLERAAETGVPAVELEAFQATVEQAIGIDIESAADAAEAFVRRNEAVSETDLEGFRMTESVDRPETPTDVADGAGPTPWDGLWAGLPVLGALVAWSAWRRRRGV